jgi:hypothetical protein
MEFDMPRKDISFDGVAAGRQKNELALEAGFARRLSAVHGDRNWLLVPCSRQAAVLSAVCSDNWCLWSFFLLFCGLLVFGGRQWLCAESPFVVGVFFGGGVS